MKRIALWAMGTGLISCVGVTTVEFAFADEKDHATKCTLATLKGRYFFALTGTLLPPAEAQESAEARAGYRVFNGDGTGTYIATTNINGVITNADGHGDLSYTVNADCTGALEILPAGPDANQEIFIAPDGDGMTAIATGSGHVEAYSSWRAGPE